MAKDRFHNVVKIALIKDGWTITHDPLTVKIGDVEMDIDLGADSLLAADRDNEKIAVEIKSFLVQASAIYQFHIALGQFINYRTALKIKEPDRLLYLAVPIISYTTFFQREFPSLIIQENKINLIIYDIQSETILEWQPSTRN
ncbi:MAG: fatty-acid oxidation protein subunit alpha [Symploca sp. SIO2B6]|nr:fatty-acid oxidation protein subunit alpha [Symploca sp. SIO2B6]